MSVILKSVPVEPLLPELQPVPLGPLGIENGTRCTEKFLLN